MYTLEKSIDIKLCSEVDSMLTMVETRVQDEVWTDMENLMLPRVELTMKSVIASSGRGVDSFVLDPDHRGFPVNIERLQITA